MSEDKFMDSSVPANEALLYEEGDSPPVSVPQCVMQALRAVADWLYAETLEGTLVNLKGLPITHQILTVAGYLAVLGLLIVTLLVEVLGPNQPSAHYIFPHSNFESSVPFMANLTGLPLSLPWLALAGVLLAFVLGWTYLLSGATECRRRIFFPILVLFILQLFYTMPLNMGELSDARKALMIGPCLCLPALVMVLSLAFGFTYRSPRWQRLTWLKWAVSLAIMLSLLLPLMIFNPQPASIILNLAAILGVPLLLAMPWWFVSGLAGVDLVMRISRFVLTGLRRMFPVSFLKKGSIAVTLAHPLAVGIFFALYVLGKIISHPEMTADNYAAGVVDLSILFEIVLIVPLVLILGWLLVSKRWTERNALTMLALNLALPFFSLTVSLALYQGSSLFDIVELATNPLYDLAPMLTFVMLMAYSALFLGAEFANSDGQLVPRRARVQLGLGAILLIIAFTLFFANLHVPTEGRVDVIGDASLFIDSDNAWTASTALSLVFLGFPYLLWTIWKDPERMLGDEPTSPAILASLDTRRVWAIMAVVLAVVASGGLCLCCCAGWAAL
jgi:hypothetical protein